VGTNLNTLADEGSEDMQHAVVVDVRLAPRRAREACLGLVTAPAPPASPSSAGSTATTPPAPAPTPFHIRRFPAEFRPGGKKTWRKMRGEGARA